jgi:hypothetical protein
MQQGVEVASGMRPSTVTTLNAVFDRISDYIRAKRNVSFDRMAFEERRQGPSEHFDDFYIGLWWLVEAEGLCSMSFFALMTTQPNEVVVVARQLVEVVVMAQQPMVFKPPVADQFLVVGQPPVAGRPSGADQSSVADNLWMAT